MRKMKICHFVKVLALYSLIFFTNTSITTYAQITVPSPTYIYKNNVHNSKIYKFINNLSLKDKTSNMNYDELIVVSCTNDLDGDNLKESIELIYNGDFILKIDDKETIVEKDVYYCPRNMFLCPNLEIHGEEYDKYKIIIISYSEAIHQVTPTVQVWVYQYKNKNINQRDFFKSL
jgi:hypothetical protein